jgi:hypothetical protein
LPQLYISLENKLPSNHQKWFGNWVLSSPKVPIPKSLSLSPFYQLPGKTLPNALLFVLNHTHSAEKLYPQSINGENKHQLFSIAGV